MVTLLDTFSGRSQYSLRLIVTEGTIDVPNNRSIANYQLTIQETSENGSWTNGSMTWAQNIGGNTLSGSRSYDFRNYDSLLLASGSYWIPHNSDGSKSISISASVGGGTTIGSASVSGTLVMDTIPRASTPSFSPTSPDAGDSVTIATNRASTSFTHDISYSVNGGTSYTSIDTGVGTSVVWPIPLSIINNWPNATSGTVIIRTITKSGSTTVGTTTKSMTVKVPTEIKPTFTSISHAEATAGVAANVGAYVQKVSKLALTLNGVAGAYGSTIASRKLEVIKSGTVQQTINSGSGTTPSVLESSGTVTLRGTVVDSRGRSYSNTVDINVLAWTPPIFTAVSAQRALSGGAPNEEGTYIRVDINGSVSSLVNTTQRNALTYKIWTRVRGTTDWGTVKKTVTPGGLTFNSFDLVSTYPTTTAYDVKVDLVDDFATSSIVLVVATSNIFMHWGDGGALEGVGIGKFWQHGALDVRGDIFAEANARTGDVGKVEGIQGRFLSTSGVGYATDNHPLQVGATSGLNIAFDSNELLARDNGAASTLNLNVGGGDLTLGKSDGSATINIRGRINHEHSPYGISFGSVAATNVGAGATVTTAVTFPSGRFTQAPRVIVGQAGSDIRDCTVGSTSITTSGFTLWRGSMSTVTRSVKADWVAGQMTSGAASG